MRTGTKIEQSCIIDRNMSREETYDQKKVLAKILLGNFFNTI